VKGIPADINALALDEFTDQPAGSLGPVQLFGDFFLVRGFPFARRRFFRAASFADGGGDGRYIRRGGTGHARKRRFHVGREGREIRLYLLRLFFIFAFAKPFHGACSLCTGTSRTGRQLRRGSSLGSA